MPANKTCDTCIFFAHSSDVEKHKAVVGKQIAADFCTKRKIVLATSVISQEEHAANRKEMATSCQHYSSDGDTVTTVNSDPVIVYDVSKTLIPLRDISEGVIRTDSCRSCLFMLNEEETEGLAGIRTNSCRRRGFIIGHGKATGIAKNCSVSADKFSDDPRNVELSLQLLRQPEPELIPLLKSKDDSPMTVTEVANPADYKTDFPVSDEDAANGIGAWRLVSNGAANLREKREVLIPVFRPDFFSPEERAKIPKAGDQDHPELYSDHLNLLYRCAAIWRELGETPALHGVSGVGKTQFFPYAAWLMQLPYERFSINNSTELDELAGRTQFDKNTGTNFVYGRIPKAWSKPCIIVIDEPNVGPPDVWQFLRPLTDSSKQLVLDMNEGERIPRNPYCFMGMAMNPVWDVRNVGTHEISDADGRRLWHIAVPAPSADLEKKILIAHCGVDNYKISAAMLRTIMNISEDLRKLAAADTIPIQWGVGQNIKVARASKFFPLKDCYRLAAADLIDPSSAEHILTTVNTHMK